MIADLLIDFDAARAKAAKPVYVIREKSNDLDAAPASLAALARCNGFSGEAGVALAGEEGALLGVGDAGDPFVSAAAAGKLPEGEYRLVGGADDKALLGWALAGYRFDRYKTGKSAAARLVAPEGADVGGARAVAAAVALARDLINTPACDMGPDALEREARRLADEFGAACSVVAGDELLAGGFNLIHAVGRAAACAPRLIDIVWGRSDAPKLTIVGKGVCFDSGGLDIKGAEGMSLMKKDMGGAANALALARLIMQAKLDFRLRLLIPAVENAISGNAFRPGDVVKSRKGLTVEIGNTDAEGRLVLADAMSLGADDEPQLMLTLATLTGAARVALGPDLPPLYCDDDKFANAVADAARAVADPVWRMPLWKPYAAMLSSPIADLNNAASGSFAGSVTAALFLKRFAPEKAIWAHFDIYAWRPKAAPGRPVGGEAQAIRALFEALKTFPLR
ncbi:MAG TPA: leucyl aminopeptidase family protein [Parvularculaceae bacterium]|nr:leucyl aminopeptidase family protein [Parvularculaceae bacterium]